MEVNLFSVSNADGNGFKDILSITLGGSNINFFGLFKNSGSSLSPVSYIGTTLDDEPKALGIGQISNFTAADFNNNGHTDILAIITTTDINDDDRLALGLFSGQGDGTFNYPDELQLLPTQLHLGEFIFDIVSKEIATGDFDEDGDTDIAITSTNTILQLLTNDGSGVFTATE
ncbi:MAG: VCBS repeat-containing protein, partial [Bacteroidota bacterium]